MGRLCMVSHERFSIRYQRASERKVMPEEMRTREVLLTTSWARGEACFFDCAEILKSHSYTSWMTSCALSTPKEPSCAHFMGPPRHEHNVNEPCEARSRLAATQGSQCNAH